MRNTFTYYTPKLRSVSVPKKGGIYPKSLWAKLSLWLLKKTDYEVNVSVEEEEFKRTEINRHDLNTLLDSILEEYDYARISRGEIDRIVIGSDLFHQISNTNIMEPVFIRTEMHLRNQGQFIFKGVNVQILPNIDGFLIIPKLGSPL